MLNPDEGYIKFECDWQEAAPFPKEDIQALNQWRQKLYEVNLLGAYPNGIGFGNVSRRIRANQFYISGSTTGNFEQLDHSHYAKVTAFDLDKNRVHCKGPIIASSESMSHAAVYMEAPKVMAVFHIHHLELWKKAMHKIPTTDPSATYGTPEMAREIMRLIRETDVLASKVFVMGGHEEGLIGFGETLDEAGEAILSLLESEELGMKI